MDRPWLALAFVVGAGVAVAQQPEAPPPTAPKVELVVDKVEFERSSDGVAFAIGGNAVNAPDRTRVRLVLKLERAEGAAIIVETTNGRFAGRLGPFRRRVLPGLYEVEATIDASLQRIEVGERLRGVQVPPGRGQTRVGTPEEAAAEREKLKRKYAQTLEYLRNMNGELDMWGSAVTMRSVNLRLRYPQEIPAQAARGLDTEWTRFVEEWEPGLAALRFDLQQVGEFVLTGYFPQVVSLLEQIMTTLDRWSASFHVAILSNLGRSVPAELAAKGAFGIDDLRRGVRTLAEQCYAFLDVPPVAWRMNDGSTPERLEDARGNVFHSLVSKFEVRKPDAFEFRLGSSPRMRIRMVPADQTLDRKIVTGVELRDYPMSDSHDELAELDEAATRRAHQGFELLRIKRLTHPDNTMPHNIRPGQEIVFSTTIGERRYQVLQYSLFCRWHKRTYTMVCIAERGLEERFEPTFRSICESFKVLDAPFLHEEGDQ